MLFSLPIISSRVALPRVKFVTSKTLSCYDLVARVLLYFIFVYISGCNHNVFVFFSPGVLAAVSERCVADASLTEICELGDKMIEEECGKVFKKEKDARKGIAFPTCISINNCVCHYSPLKSDPVIQLKNGDMCKM